MLRIDPDGVRFAGASGFVCAAAGALATAFGLVIGWWLAAVLAFLTGFIVYFFRDPVRIPPDDPDAAVSAADGLVVDVSEVKPGDPMGPGYLRIAVFMSIFNVHVNRAPVAGKVVATTHRNGKKLSAFNARAEYENEHGDTDMETPHGPVRIRQIAGLVARRVVTRVTGGEVLMPGDRIGIIRFGSRVDVFLPPGYAAAVKRGDRVRAGTTVVAYFRGQADTT